MAYFSNSSDGFVLDEQCEECLHGLSELVGCPIVLVQGLFNYSQIGNDKLKECLDLLVDKKGTCQMKPLIDKYYTAKPIEEVGEKPEYKAPEWPLRGAVKGV